MNQPAFLVAIHCLVYNHEPFLYDCFEGFVMQKTDFPFVVIVHDDASTDNSAMIISEYAKNYPHIFQPIYEIENQYSKKDGSLKYIMNNAIDKSGAKYVAICEGDDFWIDPLKLQKQVDFMEKNPDCGLCYTDYNVCNESGKNIEESHFNRENVKPILSFEDHLFRQGFISPMTWLYRRNVYKGFCDQMLSNTLDGTYVLGLEFFLNSKVSFLPITTATYRLHVGGASHPRNDNLFFLYRRSVFNIQLYYANKYIKISEITYLLKRIEMEELLPLAIKIDNKEYIEECKSFSRKFGFPLAYIH